MSPDGRTSAITALRDAGRERRALTPEKRERIAVGRADEQDRNNPNGVCRVGNVWQLVCNTYERRMAEYATAEPVFTGEHVRFFWCEGEVRLGNKTTYKSMVFVDLIDELVKRLQELHARTLAKFLGTDFAHINLLEPIRSDAHRDNKRGNPMPGRDFNVVRIVNDWELLKEAIEVSAQPSNAATGEERLVRFWPTLQPARLRADNNKLLVYVGGEVEERITDTYVASFAHDFLKSRCPCRNSMLH